MIRQKIQTYATIILIILNIFNLLPSIKIPNVLKWFIFLSIPLLIVILILPKFFQWFTTKKQQRKQNRIATKYFEKLVELVDRFSVLIDDGRSDSISRITRTILNEIQKDSEIYYKYNLVYNLFRAQLESIKSTNPNVENLRIGISKFNSTINAFYQIFIDRADSYLIRSQINIHKNLKDHYNSAMSNLERLIQEFADLCERATKDFGNIPSYGKFTIRKL